MSANVVNMVDRSRRATDNLIEAAKLFRDVADQYNALGAMGTQAAPTDVRKAFYDATNAPTEVIGVHPDTFVTVMSVVPAIITFMDANKTVFAKLRN